MNPDISGFEAHTVSTTIQSSMELVSVGMILQKEILRNVWSSTLIIFDSGTTWVKETSLFVNYINENSYDLNVL